MFACKNYRDSGLINQTNSIQNVTDTANTDDDELFFSACAHLAIWKQRGNPALNIRNKGII